MSGSETDLTVISSVMSELRRGGSGLDEETLNRLQELWMKKLNLLEEEEEESSSPEEESQGATLQSIIQLIITSMFRGSRGGS